MPEENLAPILKAIVESTDPNVILTVLERAGYAERHHAMAYLLAETAGIIYYEPDQYNEMLAPLGMRWRILYVQRRTRGDAPWQTRIPVR